MQILKSLKGFQDYYGKWMEVLLGLRAESGSDLAKGQELRQRLLILMASQSHTLPNMLFATLWQRLAEESLKEKSWGAWASVVTLDSKQ